jgi:putative IMPACT (imprinted ancient) family translation regulator
MATVEQLQEWLVEARVAYHDLQTGKALVEVYDANGERARYTAANASRLWAYIAWLEAEIASRNGPRHRRPLRPIFS